MKEYKIASIAGDGIGKEVTPEGIRVLKKVAEQHQFKIHFDEFDFASCDYHAKHGTMLPGMRSARPAAAAVRRSCRSGRPRRHRPRR